MTHAAKLAKAASALGNAAADSAYPAFGTIGKNAIINGALDVWQRGTSFAAAASGQYTADRFAYSASHDGAVTISRSTDVPTVAQAGVLANFSLLVDCTTADASIAAGQYAMITHSIEGFVWRNFAQRDLTLSFWVKATKTGTYCIAIRNSGADRAFVAEYTVNASATWEKKVISISASPSAGTWDYTTGLGAFLQFTIATGSTYQGTVGWQNSNVLGTSSQVNGLDSTSNDFRLALIQLEVGDVATDFEIRPIQQEMELCYRYFYRAGGASHGAGIYPANGDTATIGVIQVPFPVPMRALPTGTHNLTNANYYTTPNVLGWTLIKDGSAYLTPTGVITLQTNPSVGYTFGSLYYSVGTSWSVTPPFTCYLGTSVYIDFSAEL